MSGRERKKIGREARPRSQGKRRRRRAQQIPMTVGLATCDPVSGEGRTARLQGVLGRPGAEAAAREDNSPGHVASKEQGCPVIGRRTRPQGGFVYKPGSVTTCLGLMGMMEPGK